LGGGGFESYDVVLDGDVVEEGIGAGRAGVGIALAGEDGEVLFGDGFVYFFVGAEKECGFEAVFVAAWEVLSYKVAFSFGDLVSEKAGGQ
jgi:hypothetical protein